MSTAADATRGLGRGVALSAAGRLLQVAVGFAMLAVVARLVGPAGYGVFALAMLMVALAEVVVGGGLTESLVQRREIEPRHENASFWCVLAAGLGLAAAMVLLRQPVALLFAQPLLAALLPAVAVIPPVMALGAVPAALLQRRLRLGALAGVETASALAASAVAIGLALLDFGVWSLVAAEILRALARAGGLVALAGWRPSGLGSLDALGELARFNAGTLGLRALGVLDRLLPRALIGALLGAEALGFYAMAWRLFEQMNSVLLYPLNAVALPLAARAQAEPERLRALLRQGIALASAVAFPAYLGMAAVAPLLLPLILGRGWAPAIPVVQIMLLMGVRSATATFNSGVVRGLGRPDLQMVTVAAGAALTVILVPLAAPFGLVAVTLAVAARRFATWPISARQVARLTGLAPREQAGLALPNLLAALVMAALVLALHWQARDSLHAATLLALSVVLGVLAYPLALALLAPGSLAELRRHLPALLAGLRRRPTRARPATPAAP